MAEQRPNILFIMTDQQRGDCLSAEDHPVLLTPNMDSIGAKGARFNRFYSACPSCIAARRCILSGENPSTHGMVGYEDGIDWNPPATLPGVLRDNGYNTWLVGRSMHQHPPDKKFGYNDMEVQYHGRDDYQDWLARVGPEDSGGWFGGGIMHNDWTAKPWHLDEHLHFTNWTVSRAMNFLERRDPASPFFLTVSFIAPHPPLQPPAFYMDRYIRTGVPDRAIGEWAERPGPIGDAHGQDIVAPQNIDLQGEAALSTRAAYYGLINHVDDQIRRLINTITGVDRMTGNNTIVVFTSDHGEMLGDHYRWRKGQALEPSARIPFLIRAPERFGVKRGAVVDKPCTHVDIMPTLLEMAGCDVPESCEGQSMLPLLRGEDCEWRDYVHIEHAPVTQAVTDGREKYIWEPNSGRELFFDLTRDPTELRNLMSDDNYTDRISLWRDRLIQELTDRPEGFVVDGKLTACEEYYPVMAWHEEAPEQSGMDAG